MNTRFKLIFGYLDVVRLISPQPSEIAIFATIPHPYIILRTPLSLDLRLLPSHRCPNHSHSSLLK